MANPEHVEILRKGVAEWNQWRPEHPNVLPNLILADFSGADLTGADLGGTDLFRARLIGTVLNRAMLGGATLLGAELEGADLTRAQLSGAALSGAHLHNAILRDAILSSAELNRATLTSADLSGSNLRGADLRGADVTGASLAGAKLGGATLTGADLTGADLTGAELNGTAFGANDLTTTTLEGVRLTGPCYLDPETVRLSGDHLPASFLRGCGWPERLIEYWPSIAAISLNFYRGFISYSHDDRAFARRLHDQLQGRGIRVWRDEKELRVGDHVREQIDVGVRVTDKLLLVCSEASLSSKWVNAEIERYLDREDEESTAETRARRILPLDLDGFVRSGWEGRHAPALRPRLSQSFVGWERDNSVFEKAFEHVVTAMKSDRGPGWE